MKTVGAHPDELQRLATTLDRSVDDATWVRRRVDAAQSRAHSARADTRILARLEAWLSDSAVDLRRRAMRLEEGPLAHGGLLDDFHPPGFVGGGCGSVVLPVFGRRAEPGGRHTGLGEPLFASAALNCAPTLSWSREESLQLAVGPGGVLVLASRGKGTGGDSGAPGGSPPPSKRGRLKKARLPPTGRFHFQPHRSWDPREPIPWDSEKLGYKDGFDNVWRKGPSRTPGQPFEWDVQLDPGSEWTAFSKDGKHLNVTLDGRLSH